MTIERIAAISPEQARALWQWYLTCTQANPQQVQNYPQRREVVEHHPRRLQVKLREDLLAAVDSWTDPSYAQATVFEKYNSGDNMRPRTQHPIITIVNRFENISVESGTYCKAEWIDGEWQLYAADCPGSLSASSFAPSVSISPSVSTGGP
jgi:hypothetical protein